MHAVPDLPAGMPGGGWTPTKLIMVGVFLGFVLARLIEPAPPVRVVRFREVPPDVGSP